MITAEPMTPPAVSVSVGDARAMEAELAPYKQPIQVAMIERHQRSLFR